MATIGVPIRRHEVVPLKTEPVETPDGPRAPVKEPVPEKVE